MDAAKKQAEKHNLQDLVPLNALSDARFAEVSRKIVVEEIKKGRYLFRKGDRDNQSIYLLSGNVILIDGHRQVTGEVQAGTDISRYPIANQQPRTLSARAVTKIVIARIDSGLLDVFLTWDQTSSTEAAEINAEDNEDWMTQMLQSDAFIKIPPAMIQRLLIKMQSYPARQGEVVIRQGDDGDYFYTIHKGNCVVTRTTESGEEVKLAELSSGDCFGEESLVSDARRNASVTMTSDGLLMRLAKKDFVELLQKPLVRDIGYEEAAGMVDEGAVWLDVRSTGEYENSAFDDSVNIPLAQLRGEMPELVYNAKYVICCDTGRRSASAAFILSHKGFEVYVLDGGMNGLSPEPVGHDARPAAESASGSGAVVDAGVIDLTEKQEAAAGTGVAAPEQLTELEALRSEAASLRQQLAEHAAVEQKLAGSDDEASGLQREVARLEGQEALLPGQYVALQEEYDGRLQQAGREPAQAQEAALSLQAQAESIDLGKQRESGLFECNQEDWQRRVSALEAQLAELARNHETVLSERDAGREQLLQLQTAAESARQEQQEVQAARGNELEVLQAELESTGQEQQRLNSELEAERQRAVELQQQLDARLAGHEAETADQQEHSQQLQAALEAAEAGKQEIQAQLEALQAAQAEERDRLDGQAEQTGLASQEVAELQQQLEVLRAENRQFQISRDEQGEQVENLESARQVAEEALHRQQQERDGEITGLQEEIGTLKDTIAEQQMQLEKAYENASEDRARLEEEFSVRDDKFVNQIAQLESQHIELKQEHKQLQEELQLAVAGRDEIRQQLESEQQQVSELQQEVGNLTDNLSSLAAEAETEISGFRDQLEAEQQRVTEAGRQLEEGAAGSEELRARLAQEEEAASRLRGEVESQAQQLEAVQQELQQAMEHSRVVELESEESLRKAWDDLNRKNDTEKELQGQITRLRKKLEQSADDLQRVREEAREAATQARDVLHAERKERSDERAQMAARQRELKEQLVSLADQHEALQSNQQGVLAQAESAARNDERARLQDVLETHAHVEDQLAAMRQELAQAREETERAVREERQRYTAELEMARTQKSELDAVVEEQEGRLRVLTGERDDAVAEQQSIREQFNSLRAEVEVARGLINANGSGEVEDPVRLRAELEEARRNLDIAIRVRSEAETARDSAIAERDAMQQQLEGAGVSGSMPLDIPSLDGQDTAEPAVAPPPVAAWSKETVAVDSDKNRSAAATKTGRRSSRPWRGMAAGSAVVAMALLASWFMFGNRETGVLDSGDMSIETAGLLPAVEGDGAGADRSAPNTAKAEAIKPVEPPVAAKVRQQAEPRAKTGKSAVDSQVQARSVTPAVARAPRPEPEPVATPAPAPEVTPVVAGRSFSDALKGGSRGPTLVEFQPATYLMGSSGASPHFAERPRHAVSLPAFAIGKHEVSFAEYDRFARATGRRLPNDEGWGRGSRPVVNVSWKDATAYADWLSRQTGHTYSLPTEAQWEFAARGGSGTPHWWPEDSEEIPANCFDCGSEWDGKLTAAVGSFAPNDFGLHDTAGNVQEWTQDCYHKNYKGAPPDGSAWLSKGCSQRVVRGGAYTSPLDSLRSARRAQFDQDTRLDNLGFRIVRSK